MSKNIRCYLDKAEELATDVSDEVNSSEFGFLPKEYIFVENDLIEFIKYIVNNK